MTELDIAVQNADVLRAIATPDGRRHDTIKLLAASIGRDDLNLGKTLKGLVGAGLLRPDPLAGRPDRQRSAAAGGDQPRGGTGPGRHLGRPARGSDRSRPRPDLPRPSERASGLGQRGGPGELDALRADIVRNGLLQNLVVRAEPETGMGGVIRVETDEGERLPLYTLIGGERRWRAIGMAIADGEWPEDQPILCRLLDADPLETRIAALAENLLRRKLNPVEKATGFEGVARAMIDAGEDEKKVNGLIAGRLGFTPEHVQQHRRFLKLDDADRQCMTLPKDDPRHLSVREARQKLSARDNARSPSPSTRWRGWHGSN